jgi:hypothetical protein
MYKQRKFFGAVFDTAAFIKLRTLQHTYLYSVATSIADVKNKILRLDTQLLKQNTVVKCYLDHLDKHTLRSGSHHYDAQPGGFMQFV